MKKIINLIRYYCDYCFSESETIRGFIKCIKSELDYTYGEIEDLITECKEESETLEELYSCIIDLLDRELNRF